MNHFQHDQSWNCLFPFFIAGEWKVLWQTWISNSRLEVPGEVLSVKAQSIKLYLIVSNVLQFHRLLVRTEEL